MIYSKMGLVLKALLCLTLLILISSTTPLVFSDEKLSAYEVLQQYSFPIGLLPKGATGYELNRDTGEFSAYMDQDCQFSIQSYQLEYKPTITGVITRGRLKNLQGVKVQILFLWINIVEVVLDGNNLRFSVGIASTSFPIDNFVESPQCGCGLDCSSFTDGLVSDS